MADISITATAVIATGNNVTEPGRAGATIAAGQVVYKEASTNKFKLADCDSATAEVKVPYGFALNGASDGQPLTVLISGDLTMNAVLTAGTPYYLSETPGGVRATPDSGDRVVSLGYAISTTVLRVRIQDTGAVL